MDTGLEECLVYSITVGKLLSPISLTASQFFRRGRHQPCNCVCFNYSKSAGRFWRKPLNHLGLFAKFWQPGTVKTRLAVKVGNEAACELYRCFVFHLLDRLSHFGDSRTVVFSPAGERPSFESEIPPTWQLTPQSEGDLGDRMKSFFHQRFHDLETSLPGVDAPQKIVVIGADCPQLDAGRIQAAFDALDKTDVVLGPSTDGGYYLIGMKNQVAEVFDGVQWSTSSVLDQTIEQLNQNEVAFELLEPLTDVDELEDLRHLETFLSSGAKQDELDTRLVSSINHCLESMNFDGDAK